jgi:hypothetical protein
MERVNQYFKDRTENFDISIHVSEMNAIYYMYITGYNSLFLCIMIQHLRIILLTN